MNKHKARMKKMIERNGELSRDLFLSEQDICNMAGKLAEENDAQSVHMWVAKNIDNVFFYQETNA
jgi:hypothetical protein